MAATLRNAEKNNDLEITVKDLIEVYLDSKKNPTKKIITNEDKTYQWNNFLKEFHMDKKTKLLNNKIQIASFLWRQVRDNPGEKKYTSELLTKYSKEIHKLSHNNNDNGINK